MHSIDTLQCIDTVISPKTVLDRYLVSIDASKESNMYRCIHESKGGLDRCIHESNCPRGGWIDPLMSPRGCWIDPLMSPRGGWIDAFMSPRGGWIDPLMSPKLEYRKDSIHPRFCRSGALKLTMRAAFLDAIPRPMSTVKET